MIVTNKLKLDLQKPGIIPTIHAVQNDSYSRNLEIALFSDRQPFLFPENGTVVIRYKKSDGKGGEYDTLPLGTVAWWAEHNILTIALAPQVLTTPGSVLLTITLLADGTQLSVFPIRLAVEPVAAAKITKSEDYFYTTGLLPAPVSGKTGQYLRIAGTNSHGRITAVETVDCITPEKGVDYWTDADKESIIQDVITALGTPVFGSVDNNNNITLSGELATGTYTLKYEHADGTVTTIGTLTHIADDETDPTDYTNQIPISTDTDGSIYGGVGYTENTRVNSSGVVVSAAGYDCTGFIPAEMNDVIYLRNIQFVDTVPNATQRICAYDKNKVFLWWILLDGLIPQYNTVRDTINSGGVVSFTLGDAYDGYAKPSEYDLSKWSSCVENIQYIRVVAIDINSSSILTINEEIPE